jgi:hypothetical protein
MREAGTSIILLYLATLGQAHLTAFSLFSAPLLRMKRDGFFKLGCDSLTSIPSPELNGPTEVLPRVPLGSLLRQGQRRRAEPQFQISRRMGCCQVDKDGCLREDMQALPVQRRRGGRGIQGWAPRFSNPWPFGRGEKESSDLFRISFHDAHPPKRMCPSSEFTGCLA